MKTGSSPEESSGLSALPSVDAVLKTEAARGFASRCGNDYAAEYARDVLNELRDELKSGVRSDRGREQLLSDAENLFARAARSERRRGMRRLINATGVIVHTNLGRAPLSESSIEAIVNSAGYSPVEYDLETGQRGRRGERAERLAAELTGAEDALVVNNCAAAAVLVLTSLSEGGEAIISRGELVEIGGDFRVPDVMKRSGAELVEVGTTNRTKLKDYENAVTESTKLIVKVHPSNYRIVGFTSVPGVRDLAELAHDKGLLLFEDAGSGAIGDLSRFGLGDEPVIRESVEAGADVVTFSGDKLLGSVQSGFIVGKREVIGRIRSHPLYRAFRPGKLTYAALEPVLESFLRGAELEEVPVLRMLSTTRDDLEKRTADFISAVREKLGRDHGASVEAGESDSVVGGGSAPAVHPKGPVVRLRHLKRTPNEIESGLRNSDPAVISRIEDDVVILDLRTVPERDEADLASAVISALY